MNERFYCPDCGHEHDEPAQANFVLSVRCHDCDLLTVLEGRAAAREARGRNVIAVAA